MNTSCICTKALFFIFIMHRSTASISLNLLSRKLPIRGLLGVLFTILLIPIKKLAISYSRNFSQPSSYLSKVAGKSTIPRLSRPKRYPIRLLSTIYSSRKNLIMMNLKKILISSSRSNNNPIPSRNLRKNQSNC